MRRENKKIKINPRKIYDDKNFREAYERGDYKEAALILTRNPEVNRYLSGEETIEIIICYQNLIAEVISNPSAAADKSIELLRILTPEAFVER